MLLAGAVVFDGHPAKELNVVAVLAAAMHAVHDAGNQGIDRADLAELAGAAVATTGDVVAKVTSFFGKPVRRCGARVEGHPAVQGLALQTDVVTVLARTAEARCGFVGRKTRAPRPVVLFRD